MEPRSRHSVGSRVEPWIGLALCAAVVVGWAWQQLVPNQPDAVQAFAAPDWLPLAAAGVRRGGDHAPRWFAPVAARAAGAALDRSPADGVGSEWPAVRPAHRGRAHRSPNGQRCDRPVQRLLAGAGDSGAWLSPPWSCSRVSPWRARPPRHPPAQPPGTGTPRSCSRCPTRFSGCTGRWEERSGSCRPARPARAGNHC